MGSHGDVNPFVGLGAALQQRGHRVTLLANPYFQEFIERQGLEFRPLGTREEFLRTVDHPDLWHPTRSFELIFRQGVLPQLRPMYQEVKELAVPGQTVVVGSVLSLGARIAQEKLGISYVSAHLQPSVFRSVIRPPILPGLGFLPLFPPFVVKALYRQVDWIVDRMLAPEINRFRGELGLAPVRRIIDQWWHSPQLIIGLFPEWFAPPAPDWPPQARLTGFPLYDGASVATSLPEMEEFLAEGPAPVVFTPGSAMSRGRSFFQESVEACRILGCRGILLTQFPENVPPALPPGVRPFGYVPFSQVLPRAAALVHHGGIGTTAQAFAAGIPQLIMPLAHDQPDNAARVKNLGAGLTLSLQGYKARKIAERLQQLLSDPNYRQNSQLLRRSLGESNPLEETCRLIEAI